MEMLVSSTSTGFLHAGRCGGEGGNDEGGGRAVRGDSHNTVGKAVDVLEDLSFC